MKPATGGWLLLGVALTLLLSPDLNSQQKLGADPSLKKIFTSQDGAFRFQYPDSLVSCKRDPDQSNRWTPGDSCQAYLPVCSDASESSDNTAACVAYPATGFKVGTNFQAAAFSVNLLKDVNTAGECLKAAGPTQAGTPQAESINGVNFTIMKADDAGAGNQLDGYAYRNFHAGVCYELGIRIASSNLANYDPGSVKSFDVEQVRRSLKNVLTTFTFLK